MLEFDSAVEEYLHAIVRTRPWTVKRETTILEAFGNWLYAQPGMNADLDTITPAVVEQYALQERLDEPERREVEAALSRLREWVNTRGLVELKRMVKLAVA